MTRTVVKMTPSPRIKDCFIAEFDSGDKLSVTVNQIADFSVYSGRRFTEEEYALLSEAVSLARAKARALRALGSRPMSVKEMTDKLKQKGTSDETADEAVSWLEKAGFLNDEEYAGQIVRHYSEKGYGIGRIREELRRRGVPRELWDDVLEQMPETNELVLKLLRVKLKGKTPDKKEKDKAAAALMRRGFSWEEIRCAMNRLEAEEWESE